VEVDCAADILQAERINVRISSTDNRELVLFMAYSF
jgi:hypothetical protein